MKIFVVFVLVCICLNSCKPKCEDDPNLTTEELSWLPYKNGQMIIFKNDTGAVDTEYARVSFQTFCNKTDENGCTHCYQQGSNQLGSGNWLIMVYHYNKWYSEYLNSANLIDKFSDMIPQNNIVLNGNTYDNVYITHGVYFNKQYGIIAFTTFGGIKWVRIN